MPKKTIDKKFKRLYEFNSKPTQFITNYSDFQEVKTKHKLLLTMEDGDLFDAYFQGAEKVEDETKQRVYLQVEFSEGVISGEKVMGYNFPIKGELKYSDFQSCRMTEYFFE